MYPGRRIPQMIWNFEFKIIKRTGESQPRKQAFIKRRYTYVKVIVSAFFIVEECHMQVQRQPKIP